MVSGRGADLVGGALVKRTLLLLSVALALCGCDRRPVMGSCTGVVVDLWRVGETWHGTLASAVPSGPAPFQFTTTQPSVVESLQDYLSYGTRVELRYSFPGSDVFLVRPLRKGDW